MATKLLDPIHPGEILWATVAAAIPAGSEVVVRVQCSDGARAGDLVECGIDDFSICISGQVDVSETQNSP